VAHCGRDDRDCIMERVYYVRVEVARWVDEDWPGWLEVRLTEVDGRAAVIVDKVPVLDDSEARLTPGVELPADLELACDVVRWHDDADHGRSATIRLHHHIEDADARTTFRVAESRLIADRRRDTGPRSTAEEDP
jgi:hypothetical protein